MEVLAARLYDYYEKKKKKEISEIQGDKISASWGNQVRNYVFHPYQLVKDLRTGVETSQIENVLDGDLEEFIKEEIKLKDD
jgi:peptide chain release factor 2